MPSSPGDTQRTRERLVLWAILAAAVLLRGAYFAELRENPHFGMPAVDDLYHDYWARGLATGDWTPPEGYEDPEIRTTPYLRPPGYPYFLAAIYRLAGPRFEAAVLTQMAIGVLSGGLGYAVGRRWFGGPAGLVLAGFLAVYWVFIYFEGELLEPVLLVPLSLLVLHALGLWTMRMTIGRGAAAGLLVGVFALIRPNVLLFAGPALLWAAWVARRRGRWGPYGRAAAGFVAGIGATVAPAAVRNAVVGHDRVLVSANTGVNLWIGNNERANGRFVEAPGIEGFDTCFSYPRIAKAVAAKAGRPLRYSEVSAHFTRQAMEWVRAHPGRALRLVGTKALLFWGPTEVHHNKVEWEERRHSRVLRSTLLTFPIVLAMAMVGTAVILLECRRGVRGNAVASDWDGRRHNVPLPDPSRRLEFVVLILLFVLTYFASFLPFFVVGQYRVPVIPPLMLLAAGGVAILGRLVLARDWARSAACVAAGVVLAAFLSINWTGYVPNLPKWHYDRADSLIRKGRIDEGIREYQKAIAVSPTYADAHYALATVYQRQGRVDDAVREYREVMRLRPDRVEAYVDLGALLQDRGRLTEARDVYRAALRVRPDAGLAHHNLAIVLYGLGDYAGAWSAVRQSRRHGLDLPSSFIQALSQRMPDPGG